MSQRLMLRALVLVSMAAATANADAPHPWSVGASLGIENPRIGYDLLDRNAALATSICQADTGSLQSGFAHDGFTSVSIQLRAAYRF